MPGNLDHLQPVQELNRAFLGLLQIRVVNHRHAFGVPVEARAAVRVASPVKLDGVAGFPRALFELELAPTTRSARGDVSACHDEAEHDLALSMLHAARHTCRQSAYQARLLFALTAGDVERLCTLSLADLQRLACQPGVLQCALRDCEWFWLGLFTALRPELNRQLTLMALQPEVALDWPRRRPPQPSA
jgi:hypothetical protein